MRKIRMEIRTLFFFFWVERHVELGIWTFDLLIEDIYLNEFNDVNVKRDEIKDRQNVNMENYQLDNGKDF